MLRSMKALRGYKILTIDGEIGTAREFYFDDKYWTIRYLVVDTGKWLPGRQVLISPFALRKPDWSKKLFPVNLTKEQVENSPPMDEARPVSRQKEMELVTYYNWPTYWTGLGVRTPGAVPMPHEQVNREKTSSEAKSEDLHLRSSREVINYNIQALDGEIGHVDDFIIEDETWIIRYMVVDTRKWLHWLPGGKKVLISSAWFSKVVWSEKTVYVDLPRDRIKDSPEFDPATPINRKYEIMLFDFYGRPKYWIDVDEE